MRDIALKICIFSFSWKKWKNSQWWLHIPTRSRLAPRSDLASERMRSVLVCLLSFPPLPNTSQRFIYGFASIYLFLLLGVYKHLRLGPQFYRFILFPLTCSSWFICDYSNINLHLRVFVCLLTQSRPTLRPHRLYVALQALLSTGFTRPEFWSE